jgi:hypothetical protein
MISYRIGLISNVIFNDSTFTRYLFERASLITR